MLKIKLEHNGKEIWIESDNVHNFIIHDGFKSYVNKDGRKIEVQQNPRNYSQLKMALNDIINVGIRKSDATTLNQMYNEIAELKRLILNRVEV